MLKDLKTQDKYLVGLAANYAGEDFTLHSLLGNVSVVSMAFYPCGKRVKRVCKMLPSYTLCSVENSGRQWSVIPGESGFYFPLCYGLPM